MIFFTSDIHFGHGNAIKFDNRPFSSIEEMDSELIKRWNEKVKEDDVVYVLGDMFWKTHNNDACDIMKQLNGKIILIMGNHDIIVKVNSKLRNKFVEIRDYADIVVPLEDGTKRRVILSHYFMPFYNGHRYGAIHLHGHSHNSEEHIQELGIAKYLNDIGIENKIYNVGCMHWNYEPVTLDEILKRNFWEE